MATAPADRPQSSWNLLSLLLAPLHWLERSRGRRRLGLVLLYGAIATVGLAYGWRIASIRDLPDVGDPFDVPAFLASTRVHPDRDALVLYRAAASALPWETGQEYGKVMAAAEGPWSRVDPQVRRWFDEARRALRLWRRGTERPDALWMPIGESVRDYQLQGATQILNPTQLIVYFALIEAARLEAVGDMAGAWGWYRAILRCHAHLTRNCGHQQRLLVGVFVPYGTVQRRILAWANDPRVDAALLRQALRDTADSAAMSAPESDAYKVEYLIALKRLEDLNGVMNGRPGDSGPIWQHRLQWFLRNEPERARRIVRLFFLNRMAQLDVPEGRRSEPVGIPGADPNVFWMFADDPNAPPQARTRTATLLQRWAPTSLPAMRVLLPTDRVAFAVPQGDPNHTTLRMTFAERLFEIDHGTPPQRNEDLVTAGYLEHLPAGYESLDAAKPGADTAVRN